MKASKPLTNKERVVLEARHDGELTQAQEAVAKALLQESGSARDYVAVLAELQVAAQAAEQHAWESSGAPAAMHVAQAAEQPLGERPLGQLVGLLERFHDGEAGVEEMAEVEALLQAREDVAEYLLGLSELGDVFQIGHGGEVDAVDFGGFWDRIEGELDATQDEAAEVVAFPGLKKPTTAERPMFSLDDHQVLLYRFHDKEVSAEEHAQVSAWAEIDPNIAATLGALEELNLATLVAVEQIQERADLEGIWEGVSAGLGEELTHGVTSLEAVREQREQKKPVPWRREAIIALAAAVVTILGVGAFGDRFFAPTVVEKTVVIVDSLEYGDGNSVIVTGPMRQASMETGEDLSRDEEQAKGDEPEAPTVIWLIDPNEEPAAEDAASGTEKKKSDWRENPI